MKELNKLIPVSIKAIRDKLCDSEGKVASEYNGYISSFGATIKQCGLPITVIMFEGSKGSEKDKSLLLDAIWKVVKGDGSESIPNQDRMVDYVKAYNEYATHPTGDPLMQIRVEQAAIALKLAIRTFPQPK
jgi:CRISPR-associated protein Cmr5